MSEDVQDLSKVLYYRVRVKRVSIRYFEAGFAVETGGRWVIISWWRRARIIDGAKEAKKCDAQTSDSRDQNAGIQEDSASVVGNYDVIEQTYDVDEDGRRLEEVCSWLPLNPTKRYPARYPLSLYLHIYKKPSSTQGISASGPMEWASLSRVKNAVEMSSNQIQ